MTRATAAFSDHRCGTSWAQIADGLEGRDVFTLAQAKDGTVLAGTSHGIFALEAAKGSDPHWVMRSSIVNYGTKHRRSETVKRANGQSREHHIPARAMSSRVAAFDLSGDVWVAATAKGLYQSDQGATWQGGLVLGSAEYHSVAVWDGEMLAARRRALSSRKTRARPGSDGHSFTHQGHAQDCFLKDGELWVGAGDGVYFSRDQRGKSWFWLEKVPVRDVGDLAFDPKTGRRCW
jgi:hypothetical protein